MNEIRKVQRIYEPHVVSDGAGVRLKRSIASRSLDYLDPFLLLDHFGSDNPDDYIAGFPMHPHRGIETVTYMLAGVVKHRDTLGNAGEIGAGDVQWMTAGGGIMHEEMPGHSPGGLMSGFQLWVNLPARLKMTDPRYQEVLASQIPVITRPDGVTIRLIAGHIDEHSGPVTEIYVDPTYFDVAIPPAVVFHHDIPRGHTTFSYVFEGQGEFGPDEGTESVSAPRLVVVWGDGETVQIKAGAGGLRMLLVSGAPLNEPIVRYGPFVMNTHAEIEQALRDLQDGTFVR